MATTLSPLNSGKQAPRWYRKFKKIWVNTENAALTLLVFKFPAESPIFLMIKVGSSWLLENIETLLAEDIEMVDAPQ